VDLLALSLNKKKGRASVYGWDQLPLEVTLVTDRSVRSIAAKGSLYSESCQSPYGVRGVSTSWMSSEWKYI